jgi:phosphopantothenoylcysteine synthetase/decarboxylase
MHPDQLTLPGQITAPSSPIPVRPPTPLTQSLEKPPIAYESLYCPRISPYQDNYDAESGVTVIHTTEIKHMNNPLSPRGQNGYSMTKLISDTSTKMLEEMYKEMQKTGGPIQKNLDETRSLLQEMRDAQKKQRNLSFISYGIACATTSYLFYKSVTENQ